MKDFLFTSESVSEGHPDKLADQISDGILDALLEVDPKSRVACETLVKSGMVILAGEISSQATVNFDKIARDVIKRVGYEAEDMGCNWETASVLQNISTQSPDIAQGVNEDEGTWTEQGAGDQGLMFGFACDETPELMPLPIALSHKVMRQLADLRHSSREKGGEGACLRPDSKAQVTIRYEEGKPKSVDTIVVSTQHSADADLKDVERIVRELVIPEVVPAQLLTADTKYFINPTGRFVLGGPFADAGLTGRKIIVDTYGGYSRHGGGAFSGKDPSKVDRSAAYAARYLAKNIVAAGLASKCEIQLAYAIGVAEPVSIFVDTFGTSQVTEDAIAEKAKEVFSCKPRAITEQLDLLKPIYGSTAAYGHFGRSPGSDGSFSWESLGLVEAFKEIL